jgi:branched-subunit amino acid transport protein
VTWAAIIVGALACYLVKLVGLSVPGRVLRDERVQRAAALLPIALLTSLAVTQTFSTRGAVVLDVRGLAVGAALVAILLRTPFLVVVTLAALVAAGARLMLA